MEIRIFTGTGTGMPVAARRRAGREIANDRMGTAASPLETRHTTLGDQPQSATSDGTSPLTVTMNPIWMNVCVK